MSNQLTEHFQNKLLSYLAAYREGYRTHVLIGAIESWKQVLDNVKHVIIVLMDINKEKL